MSVYRTTGPLVAYAKTMVQISCTMTAAAQCAQWVAKDISFLHADSEGSEQTGRTVVHLSVFSPRGANASGDTGEIRQPKNPNTRELDRTPRHGVGILDTFSRSSKLNYIINLMARPRVFGHHILAHVWEIRPQFFKIV